MYSNPESDIVFVIPVMVEGVVGVTCKTAEGRHW